MFFCLQRGFFGSDGGNGATDLLGMYFYESFNPFFIIAAITV